MNIRAYFQKVRDVEASIPGEIVRVVSLAGDDGSINGVITEVTRAAAAKLIVDQKARLATSEEVESLLAVHEEARRRIREEQAAQRVQVTILTESQAEAIRKQATTAREKK
jgi:hypothetical protein